MFLCPHLQLGLASPILGEGSCLLSLPTSTLPVPSSLRAVGSGEDFDTSELIHFSYMAT